MRKISVSQSGNISTDRHKNRESSWTVQEDKESTVFHQDF